MIFHHLLVAPANQLIRIHVSKESYPKNNGLSMHVAKRQRNVHLSILATCRLFYQQAQHMIWKYNAFEITPDNWLRISRTNWLQIEAGIHHSSDTRISLARFNAKLITRLQIPNYSTWFEHCHTANFGHIHAIHEYFPNVSWINFILDAKELEMEKNNSLASITQVVQRFPVEHLECNIYPAEIFSFKQGFQSTWYFAAGYFE
ncbi:hypothetical protein BT63DRAFT_453508 [Microthyrium microscopicum]|uniref:Uncharacterized protein n=1 Tax=Microthyrium microscopicum TaxID=703497 RepID=A0A6A6UI57_9PEZI|nr:hypothetical protein BT63DRAFT_453508 [Microthyrium microscopicum]